MLGQFVVRPARHRHRVLSRASTWPMQTTYYKARVREFYWSCGDAGDVDGDGKELKVGSMYNVDGRMLAVPIWCLVPTDETGTIELSDAD